MTHQHKITVLCVPPEQFWRVLPHVEETLARGLRMCGIDDVGEVAERLRANTLQLWMVLDRDEPVATCLTDIQQEPDGSRWLNVHGLAGRRAMRWARQLSETLLTFAREEQCTRVRFAGRPGWAKVLPEFRPAGRCGREWVWERTVAH